MGLYLFNPPFSVASTAAILLLLQLLSWNGHTVNAGLVKCRRNHGAIPFAFRCDTFATEGDDGKLRHENPLNTAVNGTSNLTATRSVSSVITSLLSNSTQLYDPVFDAYCFNEDYPVPSLASIEEQQALYLDYEKVFDAAFDTDVLVTRDRIPGMWLRMCFHDNAINIEDTAIDFRTYVANSIDPTTNKWTAESRYMITSGADASNLICPEERKHLNNDLDETATKVLARIQLNPTLKAKHPDMSYADLLHNGCNAATIYLTNTDPVTALTTNPFTFGRKDACHKDVKCGKKYALCGPSEALPAVTFDVNEVSDWFTDRGMGLCAMMALLWTHTTLEDMDFVCPLQKMTCTPTTEDVTNFGNEGRFFNAGDELDYFDFFLNRGNHTPGDGSAGNDVDRGTCEWTVNGTSTAWPMTQIDCTLALSHVDRTLGSSSDLSKVVRNFVHNATYYNRYDLLQCALNQLSGTGVGATDNADNACALVLPTECQASAEHMFGSVYSTLPSATVPRTVVDPTCERFGYRRRHLLSSSLSLMDQTNVNHDDDDESPTEYVMTAHSDCLDVLYDMHLVIDGVHFAMVVIPAVDADRTADTLFCPPLMIHSVYDDTNGMPYEMEKVMVVFPSDIESMNDELTFHLGIRSLDQILQSYETVNVGYDNSASHIIYHPLTNNCVALLQNMAQSLNIPLRDNRSLQEFITNRFWTANHNDDDDTFRQGLILEYNNLVVAGVGDDEDATIHRWLAIPNSSTAATEDSTATEMMISKLMQYYMV